VAALVGAVGPKLNFEFAIMRDADHGFGGHERELGVARTHLAGAKDTQAGLRDLMWALVNTKEFIVNR
jgi:hypothetical protein